MHQNVVHLKPREQHILNPNAVLYVINHGEEETFGVGLTPLGIRQSQQLSVNVDAADLHIDLVICPVDLRTHYTAKHVLHHQHARLWPKCKNNEFLGPRDKKDLKEMLGLIEEAKTKRSIHLVPENGPRTLYGLCNYEVRDTPNNVLERFREEIRRELLAIPKIGEVQRIAFFCHSIVGNVVAEVLFPQFAPKLEMIELGPCDILRVSAAGCRHFPLLH